MGTWITANKDGEKKPILLELEEFVSQFIASKANGSLPMGNDWTPCGSNVGYRVEGQMLYVVADIGPEAFTNGKLSHRAKNVLVASSRGNPEVEGSPIPGLRLAFNLYAPQS